MPLKPVNWSVVIVGRWNPAILTPAGIAQHVFGVKVDPARPVEVLVPIDGLSPYVVKHPEHDVTARLDERRLRIEAQKPDYATLGEAMSAGRRVLETLPVTPFTAAGINVHFRTDGDMRRIIEIVSADIDGSLSDLGYTIKMRSVVRTLAWREGLINLSITGGEKGFEASFNFHKETRDGPKLVQWLEVPVAEVRSCVEKVLNGLGLEIEEACDGNGDE